MFNYKGSFIKERSYRPRWVEVDLSTLPFKELYSTYSEVVLVLSSAFYEKDKALNISDIPKDLNTLNSDETIDEFLTRIGNLSLPISDVFPTTNVVYAEFRDAIAAGYNITPVGRDVAPEIRLDKTELIDLRIEKDGVDPDDLFNNCLITVNGLLHRTNNVGSAVEVLWGGRSGFHADKYQVGIYNMRKLGPVSIIPIEEDHVFKGSNEQPLSERAYVKINGDIENKTVLLSIGGYLHLPGEGLVSRSSPDAYSINFKDYPIAQRYFEMNELMDISDLTEDFAKSTANENQVAVADLLSDDYIRKLLSFTQSFFIVIDTPEVFLDKQAVESARLPGKYYTASERPIYPLVAGDGKIFEYHCKEECGKHVLSIDKAIREEYHFETTHWKNLHSIDDSKVTTSPFSLSKAFFWKLGKNG